MILLVYDNDDNSGSDEWWWFPLQSSSSYSNSCSSSLINVNNNTSSSSCLLRNLFLLLLPHLPMSSPPRPPSGFIMMTPQLFINYKLKSVAHLPWRMLTYKALNTFIDDIFAFVIKMPTMYRLGCLRDDVIFFIFLYQVRRVSFSSHPSVIFLLPFSSLLFWA